MTKSHSQPDEREIRLLSNRSGVGVAEVRTLFCNERARLGIGARVGSYLAVLTAANVRAMLRRRAERDEIPRPHDKGGRGAGEHPGESFEPKAGLQIWEDDGGAVRGSGVTPKR